MQIDDLGLVKGSNGVSVTNVQINAQSHLIVTLSDGSTIDAGKVEAVYPVILNELPMPVVVNVDTGVGDTHVYHFKAEFPIGGTAPAGASIKTYVYDGSIFNWREITISDVISLDDTFRVVAECDGYRTLDFVVTLGSGHSVIGL